MANDYFRFKKFTVWQDRCAMKVGTDGTLLGAWAEGGLRILDIGTGTGLIALMMAQRFPQAHVVGIDVEHGACVQAQANVEASVFGERIDIVETPLQTFGKGKYDAIVSNPPFFVNSLNCPDSLRTTARHAVSLTYTELFTGVCSLLADNGVFSAIIPSECRERFECEAIEHGMFLSRVCMVRTVPRKQPRRCLLSFRRHPAEVVAEDVCIEDGKGQRSGWYSDITNDFYL